MRLDVKDQPALVQRLAQQVERNHRLGHGVGVGLGFGHWLGVHDQPPLLVEFGHRLGHLPHHRRRARRGRISMASRRAPARISVSALTRWLSTEPACASVESRRDSSSIAFSSRLSTRRPQLALDEQHGEATERDRRDDGFDRREGQAEIADSGHARERQAR